MLRAGGSSTEPWYHVVRITVLAVASSAAAFAYASPIGAQDLRNSRLTLPAGLRVGTFARVGGARFMVLGGDGAVYVSCPGAGEVVRLVDADGDGTAEAQTVAVSGLNRPHGLAFHNGYLHIANTDGVVRVRLGGDGTAAGAPERLNSYDPPRCARTLPPALAMQAHSAPLGITFLDRATMLPAEMRGDALVAFHGSWNRTVPTGAKVVRIRIEHGRPVSHEDFVSGWQGADGRRWGRPVDVLVHRDGSVLMSDDAEGVIYRVFRADR